MNDVLTTQTRENLVNAYPFLTPIPEGKLHYSETTKLQKQNLMALLRNRFPGIGFTARQNSNGYDIKWSDGPTEASVRSVVNVFNAYERDHTGDFYDYMPSDFNRLFGGYKFLFCNRLMKPETHDVLEACGKLMAFDRYWRTDFPAGIRVTGYNAETDEICYEQYSLLDANVQACAGSAGLRIEEYSEKAVVVRGDTKPVKDMLKGLGGRFNFKLQGGPGWIFPKTKVLTVKAALGLAQMLVLVMLIGCGTGTAQQPHHAREESYALADSVREAQYAGFAKGISERYPNRPVTAAQVQEALTAPTWTAPDGREYIVQTGAKGGHYVLRTSKKTGKQYKVYLRRHDDGSFSTYR